MKKATNCLAVLGAILAPLVYGVPAQAQATRTWVSGVGDDANPCGRTAPCKTFAGAISKTFTNGEINCLDPGGFSAVTITKSITIDCHEIFASILASFTTGVIINIAAGNPNDPLRTVRLRNLNISGAGAAGSVGTRTGIHGVRIDSAANVFLEDMLISDFSQNGVLDQRSTGGKLFITNSTIRHNANRAVLISPASGSVKIDATLVNALLEGNGAGISVGRGVRAVIDRSTLSGNGNAGILAHGASPGGEASVDGSVISGNGTGLDQAADGVIRLSDNDISFNLTGVSGTVLSFTNNRFVNNGAGGTIAPIGGTSNPTGQQ